MINTDHILQLADLIESKYLPFAWACECKGEHPDCSMTMSTDTYAIAQADTVLRITRLIREVAHATN